MNKFIILKDRVYGTTNVDSPVLIELINLKPVQRLKKIAQFGIPDEFYHLKNYSRYEHCIGVMLLLKKIGASLEEQIAGLLHDVSHTAFSHVVDWVIGTGHVEDYQDTQHKNVIENSEIRNILQRHGYSPHKISDYHHFTLLEKDLPQVCADRIDYSLREFPIHIAKTCQEALTVRNGKIVFKSKASALLFAKNFLKKQMAHWGGFEAVNRYKLFANMLKRAIDQRLINFSDFWKDDDFIVRKLKSSKDPMIQKTLSVLRNKSLRYFAKSSQVAYKKFRYVDPEFLSSDKLMRLSKVDKKFERELENARTKNSQGIVLITI